MKTKYLKLNLISEFCLLHLFLFPIESQAYLDPGTGSMLLSVFIGMTSALYFGIRNIPSLMRKVVFKLSKNEIAEEASIVFYSESKNYWLTFKPVLESLVRTNSNIIYLTSDEEEIKTAKKSFPSLNIKFIGIGNKAFTKLNFLKCDVLVLTTPGLDVLQIKRSKGVGTYVHIVHSLSDIHGYKLFSFDYYDVIIASGQSQKMSLLDLEKIRNQKKKTIIELGCPYLDTFYERAQLINNKIRNKVIIFAPTWGKNSFLYKLSPSVFNSVSRLGYKIIFRPHPQSRISDKKILSTWLTELQKIPGSYYDQNPDGFETLSKASILISDLSGVVFDFAFIFKKPVITLGDGFKKEGFEAWDLSRPAWEVQAYQIIGRRMNSYSINELINKIKEVEDVSHYSIKNVEELIKTEAVNLGTSGPKIAEYLASLTTKNKLNS